MFGVEKCLSLTGSLEGMKNWEHKDGGMFPKTLYIKCVKRKENFGKLWKSLI